MVFVLNCRLVATHYPHHCLVGDWLDEELSRGAASPVVQSVHVTSCSVDDLCRGYFIFCFIRLVIVSWHHSLHHHFCLASNARCLSFTYAAELCAFWI